MHRKYITTWQIVHVTADAILLHMLVCSVQWPKYQLCSLGWAAGIVPFMLMADGARGDVSLLEETGRGRTWENRGIKMSKWVGGKRMRGEKTMATTDEEKERLGQKLLFLIQN